MQIIPRGLSMVLHTSDCTALFMGYALFTKSLTGRLETNAILTKPDLPIGIMGLLHLWEGC